MLNSDSLLVPAAADLVLLPETQARRILAGRCVRFSVLAPVGAWVGLGSLRVLRAATSLQRSPDGGEEEVVGLVCGYESYERYD
ncbi:MAG: hypothetical protein M1314_01595 [Firmicutes bacterium]|nr:hypothetical protein [Bacillota bacterium]